MRRERVSLPPWNSLRVRLTLGNVLVLALILGTLGGSIRYLAQAALSARVDADLTSRAKRFARMWPPPQWDDLLKQPPPPLADLPIPLSDALPANQKVTPDVSALLNGQRFFWFKVMDAHQCDLLTGKPQEPWNPPDFAAALHRGESRFATVAYHNEPMRLYSVPLWHNGKIDGVFQIALPLQFLHQELSRLTGTLLTVIPLAFVAASAGGIWLTDRALRPVRHITQAASRIEARSLSGRLPVQGQDEFAELSATFNAMLARLEDAFEQQRRFTADASHELRTPLTVILGQSSRTLGSSPSQTEYRDAMESVRLAAGRMNRIVQDLLFLARSDQNELILEKQELPLTDLLRDAVESVPPQSRNRITLADTAGEGKEPTVYGAPDPLVRLFGNLLNNAVLHTPPDRTVTIAARPSGRSGMVVITVSDTGDGIAAHHLPHLFERFYRICHARSHVNSNDANSGGTGLGLSICKSIVDAHHGHIDVQSAAGQGTTVSVTLPASA